MLSSNPIGINSESNFLYSCTINTLLSHSKAHTWMKKHKNTHTHTLTKNSWACMAKGFVWPLSIEKGSPSDACLCPPDWLTWIPSSKALRWFSEIIYTTGWPVELLQYDAFLCLYLCVLCFILRTEKREFPDIEELWKAPNRFFWWNWRAEIGYVRGYVGNIPVLTHPLSLSHTRTHTGLKHYCNWIWSSACITKLIDSNSPNCCQTNMMKFINACKYKRPK